MRARTQHSLYPGKDEHLTDNKGKSNATARDSAHAGGMEKRPIYGSGGGGGGGGGRRLNDSYSSNGVSVRLGAASRGFRVCVCVSVCEREREREGERERERESGCVFVCVGVLH